MSKYKLNYIPKNLSTVQNVMSITRCFRSFQMVTRRRRSSFMSVQLLNMTSSTD